MSGDTIEVTLGWEGLTLAGSLHLPAGTGPHPAMLLLQGSGPADRDSGGYFPSIRSAFLERGIATLAIDKPGCGASTGDWRDHGLAERADQAVAALAQLRLQPAIDGERVGVWGQSQGGWLVQMLAGRGIDLAAAIANSGPSIDVPRQDLYGCEHTMRRDGFAEDDIAAALAFVRALHRAAEDGADLATVTRDVLEPAMGRSWYGHYHRVDALDEADWRGHVRMVTEGFDPLAALARVECSFLAIYGALDPLVPAWLGAEETGRALAAAGTGDATVVVFPGGDHRIKDPASGDFVDGYLDLLGDWTARRL